MFETIPPSELSRVAGGGTVFEDWGIKSGPKEAWPDPDNHAGITNLTKQGNHLKKLRRFFDQLPYILKHEPTERILDLGAGMAKQVARVDARRLLQMGLRRP